MALARGAPWLDTVSPAAVGSPLPQPKSRAPGPAKESGIRMSRLVFGWLTALMAGMPLRLGYLLARMLTEAHFRMFPSRRHTAITNLAAALPRSTRRERLHIVRRMMTSYNYMLFEFFRLPHLTREELMRSIDVQGREHLDRALARGPGVVICCTRIGRREPPALAVAHSAY